MKLICVSEISRKLGVSDKTIRKYQERLPGAVVIGKRTLYREEEVLKFIEAGGISVSEQSPETVSPFGGVSVCRTRISHSAAATFLGFVGQ